MLGANVVVNLEDSAVIFCVVVSACVVDSVAEVISVIGTVVAIDVGVPSAIADVLGVML